MDSITGKHEIARTTKFNTQLMKYENDVHTRCGAVAACSQSFRNTEIDPL